MSSHTGDQLYDNSVAGYQMSSHAELKPYGSSVESG